MGQPLAREHNRLAAALLFTPCLRQEEAVEVVKYCSKGVAARAEQGESRTDRAEVWVHQGGAARLVQRMEWDGKWVFLPDLRARVRAGVDVSEGMGTATAQPRVRIRIPELEALMASEGNVPVLIVPGLGKVSEVRFENDQRVRVGQVRAPGGVERVWAAVARLWSMLRAEGGSAEPTFNEGEGDYVQLGVRGLAGPPVAACTHMMTRSGWHEEDEGAGPVVLSAWMHENMDMDLRSTGIVFEYLVRVHQHGKGFMGAGERAGEGGVVQGKGWCGLDDRSPLRLLSPVGLAAAFLELPPWTVHAPLALVLRACTHWLPAHWTVTRAAPSPHTIMWQATNASHPLV